MRRWIVLVVALLLASDAVVPAPETPGYLDRSFTPAERAADLVARMTLAEKASQMISSRAPAIPRLGVEAYGWWNEAAHGVAREQTNDGAEPPNLTNTTSYPVSLSLGSTWNPDLVYREAALISDEARDVVRDNRFDLDFYTPTVNLARDPRWGRNDESFGEDPLLTAELASQFVNGMQGQAPDGTSPTGYLKTIATLKHYAANNSESNRLNGSSDMDERTLREYYTAQFRDIIRWSHPGSMMSSYNSVNGVPAAANPHLIETLARQTYGFGGYFTSDCDAIYEIMAGQNWLPPGGDGPLDQYGRTAWAQTAGEDLDCNMGYHDDWNYANTIPDAVARGIRTGNGIFTENDVDVSLVRLFTARFALGEFDAEDRVPWVAQARARLAPGLWTNSEANLAVTQTPTRLEMARTVADESIVLLQNKDGELPLRSPERVAVIGTFGDPADMYLGGYSSTQTESGVQKAVSGYQGLKDALPGARVDFLAGTLPGDLDTVDPAAITAAAGYDAVIVYAGTDRSTSSEDHDRTTLELPGAQAELIRRVAQANPNTIAYLETVGQVDVAPFAASTRAILWSSFNGQRKGAALADILTGAVTPSGRLPFTWYADERQLPPIEDYAIRSAPGRTYQYFTGTVAYPFGFGLSYTTFDVTGMRVSPTADTLTVTATVTNTGRRTGAEVLQLYATTPDAPAVAQRPRQRLVAFRKVTLAPGASTRVTLPVKVADLAFFDEKTGTFQVDLGRYGLQLGTSSKDIKQQVYATVSARPQPTPLVVTAKPVAEGDAGHGITQRVRFAIGDRIEPHLTVALSDQKLLTSGFPVVYRSNRRSVVSDDLAVRGPGVATITATVTIGGATATGSFVVQAGSRP
jgi:beta-glucosidase